jgi:hypothetical protein
MATEADVYKPIERLIDESDAVPSLTATMITDEATPLADLDSAAEALVKLAAHARFQRIAAEILDVDYGHESHERFI